MLVLKLKPYSKRKQKQKNTLAHAYYKFVQISIMKAHLWLDGEQRIQKRIAVAFWVWIQLNIAPNVKWCVYYVYFFCSVIAHHIDVVLHDDG